MSDSNRILTKHEAIDAIYRTFSRLTTLVETYAMKDDLQSETAGTLLSAMSCFIKDPDIVFVNIKRYLENSIFLLTGCIEIPCNDGVKAVIYLGQDDPTLSFEIRYTIKHPDNGKDLSIVFDFNETTFDANVDVIYKQSARRLNDTDMVFITDRIYKGADLTTLDIGFAKGVFSISIPKLLKEALKCCNYYPQVFHREMFNPLTHSLSTVTSGLKEMVKDQTEITPHEDNKDDFDYESWGCTPPNKQTITPPEGKCRFEENWDKDAQTQSITNHMPYTLIGSDVGMLGKDMVTVTQLCGRHEVVHSDGEIAFYHYTLLPGQVIDINRLTRDYRVLQAHSLEFDNKDIWSDVTDIVRTVESVDRPCWMLGYDGDDNVSTVLAVPTALGTLVVYTFDGISRVILPEMLAAFYPYIGDMEIDRILSLTFDNRGGNLIEGRIRAIVEKVTTTDLQSVNVSEKE